jgi:hypothetical protein
MSSEPPFAWKTQALSGAQSVPGTSFLDKYFGSFSPKTPARDGGKNSSFAAEKGM